MLLTRRKDTRIYISVLFSDIIMMRMFLFNLLSGIKYTRTYIHIYIDTSFAGFLGAKIFFHETHRCVFIRRFYPFCSVFLLYTYTIYFLLCLPFFFYFIFPRIVSPAGTRLHPDHLLVSFHYTLFFISSSFSWFFFLFLILGWFFPFFFFFPHSETLFERVLWPFLKHFFFLHLKTLTRLQRIISESTTCCCFANDC